MPAIIGGMWADWQNLETYNPPPAFGDAGYHSWFKQHMSGTGFWMEYNANSPTGNWEDRVYWRLSFDFATIADLADDIAAGNAGLFQTINSGNIPGDGYIKFTGLPHDGARYIVKVFRFVDGVQIGVSNREIGGTFVTKYPVSNNSFTCDPLGPDWLWGGMFGWIWGRGLNYARYNDPTYGPCTRLTADYPELETDNGGPPNSFQNTHVPKMQWSQHHDYSANVSFRFTGDMIDSYMWLALYNGEEDYSGLYSTTAAEPKGLYHIYAGHGITQTVTGNPRIYSGVKHTYRVEYIAAQHRVNMYFDEILCLTTLGDAEETNPRWFQNLTCWLSYQLDPTRGCTLDIFDSEFYSAAPYQTAGFGAGGTRLNHENYHVNANMALGVEGRRMYPTLLTAKWPDPGLAGDHQNRDSFPVTSEAYYRGVEGMERPAGAFDFTYSTVTLPSGKTWGALTLCGNQTAGGYAKVTILDAATGLPVDDAEIAGNSTGFFPDNYGSADPETSAYNTQTNFPNPGLNISLAGVTANSIRLVVDGYHDGELKGDFEDNWSFENAHSPGVSTWEVTVLPPILIFTHQPTITDPTTDGGTIAYGTADADFEDLLATINVITSIVDRQIIVEAVSAIINAGASITDTKQMVESLIVNATVSVSVADQVQQVESLLAQISAFPSVVDIYNQAGAILAQFDFSAQPSIQSQTTNGAAISYGTFDTQADDVTSNADIIVQVTDLVARIDNLLTNIQAVPSVSDLLTQIEAIVSNVTVTTTVIDAQFAGVVDGLLSAATGISSVTDMQQMVETVTFMAQNNVSISEIASFLEQVTTAATSSASVIDLLRGRLILIILFFVVARDPLALTVTVRDPLALNITCSYP